MTTPTERRERSKLVSQWQTSGSKSVERRVPRFPSPRAAKKQLLIARNSSSSSSNEALLERRVSNKHHRMKQGQLGAE